MEFALEILTGVCIAAIAGLSLFVINSRISLRVMDTRLRAYETSQLTMAADLGGLRAELVTLIAETREANRRYEDLAGGLRHTVDELEARYLAANQIYVDAIATVHLHGEQLETMGERVDSVRADMVRYLGERDSKSHEAPG